MSALVTLEQELQLFEQEIENSWRPVARFLDPSKILFLGHGDLRHLAEMPNADYRATLLILARQALLNPAALTKPFIDALKLKRMEVKKTIDKAVTHSKSNDQSRRLGQGVRSSPFVLHGPTLLSNRLFHLQTAVCVKLQRITSVASDKSAFHALCCRKEATFLHKLSNPHIIKFYWSAEHVVTGLKSGSDALYHIIVMERATHAHVNLDTALNALRKEEKRLHTNESRKGWVQRRMPLIKYSIQAMHKALTTVWHEKIVHNDLFDTNWLAFTQEDAELADTIPFTLKLADFGNAGEEGVRIPVDFKHGNRALKAPEFYTAVACFHSTQDVFAIFNTFLSLLGLYDAPDLYRLTRKYEEKIADKKMSVNPEAAFQCQKEFVSELHDFVDKELDALGLAHWRNAFKLGLGDDIGGRHKGFDEMYQLCQ